jgi:hypothetical protein
VVVVVCWVGFGGYGIGDDVMGMVRGESGWEEGVVFDDCHVLMNEVLVIHTLTMMMMIIG